MVTEAYHDHVWFQIGLMLCVFYSMAMIHYGATKTIKRLFYLFSVVAVAWMAIHPYIEWLEPY